MKINLKDLKDFLLLFIVVSYFPDFASAIYWISDPTELLGERLWLIAPLFIWIAALIAFVTCTNILKNRNESYG